MVDGAISEMALLITAVATLINAISSYRNGRKLDKQDSKMDQQSNVLAEVHTATNGELAPKIAQGVKQAKSEIAEAVIEAARAKYIKND